MIQRQIVNEETRKKIYVSCKNHLYWYVARKVNFLSRSHLVTITEVQCPIPQPFIAESDPDLKEVFVHGYQISVSNTGKEYSISQPLFIFDTTCQVVANISGDIVFVLKVKYLT